MSHHDGACPCWGKVGAAPVLSRRDALRLGTGLGVTSLAIGSVASTSAASWFRRSNPVLHDPQWPPPTIIPRWAWGADESLRDPDVVYTDVVEKLVVHHTATPNSPPDPAATVRGVYAFHTSGVYSDIAYNWLVDHRGSIYQGRWAANGDTIGESGGRQVVGGHTGGFNSRTIGVALLGTHTSVAPTAEARDALARLLTWKCARWGIDPLARDPYETPEETSVTVPNIFGHREVRATTCPGDPVMALLPALRQEVDDRLRAGARGYWIADADGDVLAFGDVADAGDPKRDGAAGVVAITGHPSHRGYWLAGADGAVFSYGVAEFYGSMANKPLNAPIVDIATTANGRGYWLLARDGGVFAFGDAPFHGSTTQLRLNQPVAKIESDPAGRGYWILTVDGGVFTFGDVDFHGSTGDRWLAAPIVSMAATPTGNGYWLLGLDGGVFTFGDARFFGSTGAMTLVAPVIDMVGSADGRGYALLGRDGGLFAFGDVSFHGSGSGTVGRAVGLAGPLR